MKNNNKVLSLLGLATKAGKIASGEFSTEKSVKSGKVFWYWLRQTHPKIQRKNSVICVSFTKYRYISSRIKRNWENSVARNFVPVWRYRMRTLRKQC